MKDSVTMKELKKVLITFISLIIIPSICKAQNTEQEKKDYVENGAIGFFIGYPVSGISGIYNPNETLGLQVIVDIFGNRKSISGRGLYRFITREHTNTYGYGMIGSFEGINDDSFGLGFGAGAGVEYSWQSFSGSLPPIWGSIDLGFTSWDSASGNTTRITFTAGINYYF